MNQIISTINWSAPSWDLFIGLFFVIATLLYGFALGRERMFLMMVSVYMSLVVIMSAPWLGATSIAGIEPSATRAVAFVVFFMVLFFLLTHSVFHSLITAASRPRWWQSFLFGFLQAGLVASVVLSLLPPNITSSLSEQTRFLFLSNTWHFVWIVAPILAMVVAREKKV